MKSRPCLACSVCALAGGLGIVLVLDVVALLYFVAFLSNRPRIRMTWDAARHAIRVSAILAKASRDAAAKRSAWRRPYAVRGRGPKLRTHATFL